jgi:hypothetical protein
VSELLRDIQGRRQVYEAPQASAKGARKIGSTDGRRVRLAGWIGEKTEIESVRDVLLINGRRSAALAFPP